jgi:hypothetical protein
MQPRHHQAVVGLDTTFHHHVILQPKHGWHFSHTLFCSQNTVQLMTAGIRSICNQSSDTPRE